MPSFSYYGKRDLAQTKISYLRKMDNMKKLKLRENEVF
ncbi:hypothetical protein JOC27_000176 [Sporolactobacillus spathodeae]|uniref:Uncharacterized protein n=1 Tax=Sporolactobacillus spathodeae TaxID=1465502 RepID=A0ABS2Q4Q2_9BACL|nr:hypothetical protein [Sporolactobacillus spathodeae]